MPSIKAYKLLLIFSKYHWTIFSSPTKKLVFATKFKSLKILDDDIE
jgi:hypothetical protein